MEEMQSCESQLPLHRAVGYLGAPREGAPRRCIEPHAALPTSGRRWEAGRGSEGCRTAPPAPPQQDGVRC